MRAVSSLRSGWQRFWFQPQSTATVEMFRIGFGVLVTLWMLSMLPVFASFYGADGAVPETPTPRFGAWTLFTLVSGTPWIWVVWLAGLVAAVALAVGFRTRLAAVVVFVVVVSLTRQAPWVFNAGDSLIRVMAFYMMFMPAGSAVAVDRWRDDPRGFWSFPRRAPWALRLAQIQLSVIYLSTVWEKAGGALWRNGTAVSYALRVDNVNRIPVPEMITDSIVLMQLATYGTLAVELALGVLVWNRAARPWILALGVMLHLSIDFSLTIGFFSFAMLTLYLVFVPPRAAERSMAAVRARMSRTRSTFTTSPTSTEPRNDRVEPDRGSAVTVPASREPTISVDETPNEASASSPDDQSTPPAEAIPTERTVEVAGEGTRNNGAAAVLPVPSTRVSAS